MQFSIQILPDLLQTIEWSQLVVLTDSNTAEHCYPNLKPYLPAHIHLSFPAGEQNKTMDTCSLLWNQLIEKEIDRKAIILNLGGGVVTDLGGYLASCFKRGIRFMNIPTTLLAMVDASIGGKTGVNHNHIKNSVGLFSDAVETIIDAQFLQTLPQREMQSGKAEIIKHGLIASNLHFHNFLSMGDDDNFTRIIQESIQIKQDIVSQDRTEQGLRKVLNFGHTISHAIESFSLDNHGEEHLLHGEAVAIGLIVESYLSIEYAGLSHFLYENIRNSIKNYFQIPIFSAEEIDQIVSYLKHDKKNDRSELRLSLIEDIGESVYDIHVSMEDCAEAITEVCT